MGLFKPTFSISQMTETKLAWAMPWRENEGEANVFVKPEDQRELARFGLAWREKVCMYTNLPQV